MIFSIIIPIYNAEKWLSICINSVLAQSCQDWELILVNDGSTDNSDKIIEQYAQKDRRICVIQKQNEGQLFARRKGIERATGEYLLFLDSDDYWHPECLAILEKIIKEKTPDVVMFPAKRIGETRHEQEIICNISKEQEWIDKSFVYGELISGTKLNSLCLKAWKRTLFEGDNTDYSRFSEVCWGEDRAQLLFPITQAEKIFYIPDVLYFYVDNPNSVTHVIQVDKIPLMISNNAFELLYSYVKLWDMDLPDYQETIAVQYLRNYINAYYKVRNSCRTKAEKKHVRMYDWNSVVSKKAFRYMFSKKLSCREKIKLILAKYFKI